MTFLQKIESWFQTEEAAFVAFMQPMLTAYFKNLEAVGIKDAEAFIAAAEPVALAAASGAISGASGSSILGAVVGALSGVALQYGAQAGHDALTSVLNTTAELLHQPAVAVRVDAPPTTPAVAA